MKKIYETAAFATAGRGGRTQLDDGSLAFDLAIPGSGKEGTNPEQLFAMGYAACFDNAAKVVAQRQKLPPHTSETHVTVALVQDGEQYRLAVKIGLKTSGLSKGQALELLEVAHAVCPYSDALRGNAQLDIALLD